MTGNTHVQVENQRANMAKAGLHVLYDCLRTRAASYGSGFGDFEKALVEGKVFELACSKAQNPSQKMRSMAAADVVINDEAFQWPCQMGAFAIHVRRQMRSEMIRLGILPQNTEVMGQQIFAGDMKQCFPILPKALEKRAIQRQARWPEQETVLDDYAILAL